MSDYDSPWKEAVEEYFQAFMLFFFPVIAREIAWSRGYEWLDKELQQIAAQSETGRRTVDKLVKVWREDGLEEWVLVHVEVQSQEDPEFLTRMYVYNYRLFDRYHRQVASLAVLADDNPTWRPDRFGYSLWGSTVEFSFPAVKSLDWADRAEELERDRNPFAAVLLAHLRAMQTRHDLQSRRAWKLRLIKGLYERGFDRENIRKLFRLIDWLMELPEELSELFWDEIARFEEERKVPYVTSVERIGEKRGRAEGRAEGLGKGELIGRIHLCQRRLGMQTTRTEELVELATDQLQEQAERLEKELFGS